MKGLVVGLTGGIGSGKSAVADCFARRGVAIVDTDLIAHELTSAQGAAMPALCALFGDDIVDGNGALDRAAMRRMVFADPSARKSLEGVLHPLIRDLAQKRGQEALGAGAPYVMVVVPLLLEAGGYRDWVDRVLVVDCADETRIERVMRRSGLTRDTVLSIMAAQLGREARLAAADEVIDNNGSIEDLIPLVGAQDARYRSIAATISATG